MPRQENTTFLLPLFKRPRAGVPVVFQLLPCGSSLVTLLRHVQAIGDQFHERWWEARSVLPGYPPRETRPTLLPARAVRE